MSAYIISKDRKLTGVTSLHLSSSHDDIIDRASQRYVLLTLAASLPNLLEEDFGSLRTSALFTDPFFEYVPHLIQFTWDGASSCVNGADLSRAVSLVELYLDGCHFHYPREARHHAAFDASRKHYMLMYCKRLERLSIKNATMISASRERPVSQGMIIKFVRRTPNLHWLRSDLTGPNVIMLQQERPDITFVTV
jgi:hypothetical protein